MLNYVLDSGAKKILIALPATLRKQWEVELEDKFGKDAVILDRLTVVQLCWSSCRSNVSGAGGNSS